ncbi:MAG: protein kinase [Myxococcota bacterium]
MSHTEANWGTALGPPPGPGDTVAGYTIDSLIGSGGMASVYRARTADQQLVALKIVNPARVLPEDVRRFTREYRALASMDHENIVKVHEAGVDEGYPWLAMELVDGIDLETQIIQWQQHDVPDRYAHIESILRGLCKGLAYVHDQGLIHRDLKPSNVLLTKDGRPKISDFGVVKADSTASTQLTLAGRLVGTVAFMAPELITTDEDVDRRADLYGLGAVLYVMCTFRRPIEAESVAGYLARHLTEIPKPITEIEPQAPLIFERIAQRLLQKDRTFRYPNAHSVLQALDRADSNDMPPLRGRDEPMHAFARRLQALRDGAGGVLAIRGPRGAGKSHLLDVMLDQVRSQGLALGRADHRSTTVMADLGRSLADEPTPSAEELQALLTRNPETPTVLAVDDLDRAPAVDVRELTRLVRALVGVEARPVLVVFTATELEGEPKALQSGSATGLPSANLDLGPLDNKSSIALVRDRGVSGPAAPALGRRLCAMYDGLPGPMTEQLEALQAEGWLIRDGDQWKATRPLDHLRKADLPVPRKVAQRIEAQVAELTSVEREIVQLLALLDRPGSAALVERCFPNDRTIARSVDDLVGTGVLSRTMEEQQELVALADPCAPRVVRRLISPEVKPGLHLRLAQALQARRRRSNALEVAHHLRAAGQVGEAWPRYIEAARRSAREGLYSEVIEICRHAEEIEAEAVLQGDPTETLRNRRWLYLLKGEALASRRAWAESLAPLSEAVAVAREDGDEDSISRCLGSLGRAYHRLGRYAEAEPRLREALAHLGQGAPDRASTLRTLADVQLQQGRMPEAEQLWTEARDLAIEVGNPDAEARALRGLGHLRALEGQLEEASRLLNRADDLLQDDGDYRVRAGVLARAAAIAAASGHYDRSLYRAELLVELSKRHGMADRMPIAYAQLAEVHQVLGAQAEALAAVHQCMVFAGASNTPCADARLRAARVLLDLGQPADAWQALPTVEDLSASPIDTPALQLTLLRARISAADDAARTRATCEQAIEQTPPLDQIMRATLLLDAIKALWTARQADLADELAVRALDVLGRIVPCDGLQLETWLLRQQIEAGRTDAAPPVQSTDRVRQLARGLLPKLPPQAAEHFRGRPGIVTVVSPDGY